MEPAAIFLVFIVLVLIILFVTRPFFVRRRELPLQGSHQLSFLLAERERLLTALQELDFDNSLGKIPVEDYPLQRSLLLQKGAEILRQLDGLTSQSEKQVENNSLLAGSESKPATSMSDDELEDLLANRRSSHREKTAGFCPRCGKPVLLSDAFCPSCGNTLK